MMFERLGNRCTAGIVLCLFFFVFYGGYESAGAAGENDRQAVADASKIVKRVKNTLDDIDTFSCSFETVQVWRDLDRTQHIAGILYMTMKKPFKLRMERPGHIVVIDGESVWTYLPEHNQVQITDYDSDGAEFPSPQSIFQRYADEREARVTGEETIHGGDCDIIELTPPDPAGTKVTVWIDRTLNFPVKAREETPSGDIITHDLKDVRINDKIDDDIFTFYMPEGAMKVDMRE